jgi:peroxiredoxin
MTISVGQKLPASSFKIVKADGADNATTDEIFAGKTVVLFGVPGAFTPTCSNSHLPGFLENHDAILGKGADTIAVVAVNDHHVMRAWAKFSGGEGKLLFIADGNGEFTRAIGMETDMTKSGLGFRTKRFSMIVENGIVTAFNTDDAPGQAVVTGAARILEQLERQPLAAG